MNKHWSRSVILLLILFLVTSACQSQTILPTSQNTQAPTSTGTSIPTGIPPSATPRPSGKVADTIFYNGTVITLEESHPLAQAIALRNGLIQAVGTDEEVLAFQGSDTTLINLVGYTLMPGFIDGHTHVLAFPARKGKTLAEAQETAIRYGFTTVTEMWADQGTLDTLLQAEQDGSLHLRVNVFPSYNDGVMDANHHRILLETWYPEHDPVLEPQRMVRIPGIKIFVDGDNASPERGCWALSEPYMLTAHVLEKDICNSDWGDIYWMQEELNEVVLQAQNEGYRVAFHAMGDRAIETALNAIEYALDGRSNGDFRHQIEHNSLLRPDLLPRYDALDIVVSVRGYGDFCNLDFLVPTFGRSRSSWYANRYALPGLGIPAYVETDFGWTVDPDDRFSQRTIDPIMQLYGLVTHRFVADDGSICEPDPLVATYTISVERALQMLTIEPAYAVSMENYTGSLRTGKYADLIILSGNPLSIDPAELKNLQVWMTMIAGKTEYCAKDHSLFCP